MVKTAEDYLKEPYGRVVSPEPDGTFRAEIVEFPGCIATGESAAEAFSNLEEVAISWIEALLSKGKHVPEPIDHTGYSGKLVLRLPKSLHKKAAHLAARDGVSLNQFIVSCLAQQVGSKSTADVQPIVAFVSQFMSAAALRSVDTRAQWQPFASMTNIGTPVLYGLQFTSGAQNA